MGNIDWYRSFGGKSDDFVQSIIINENKIYLSGAFRDTLYFGADNLFRET